MVSCFILQGPVALYLSCLACYKSFKRWNKRDKSGGYKGITFVSNKL